MRVYITDCNISTTDDQAQLANYRARMKSFLDTECIHGITIGGWVMGKTWSQAPDSGLNKTSGAARPAMTWLMTTLNRPQP